VRPASQISVTLIEVSPTDLRGSDTRFSIKRKIQNATGVFSSVFSNFLDREILESSNGNHLENPRHSSGQE
jgi:hypothetical protein